MAFYATREQEATITSTTMTMPSILLKGNSDLDGSDFGRFIGSHNNSDNLISSSSHNNNNEAAEGEDEDGDGGEEDDDGT